MSIETKIQQAAVAAVKAIYGQDVPEKMVALQKTRPEFDTKELDVAERHEEK